MRSSRLTTALVVIAVMGGGSFARPMTAAADAPPPPPFVVVVNAANPSRALGRKFVGEAFLKKTTRWPNGDVIRPVDLVAEAPARERFSEDVLKRSTAEVRSYWQQVIFSGRDVPPPELPDDDAVVKYVAQHATAIGYVSGSARIGDVRPVALE